MDFLLDLLQGAGLAAAVGIRPFLPVLLAGALATADVGLDFDGTDFSFLETWPFLLAVLVLVALADFAGRRMGRTRARPARSLWRCSRSPSCSARCMAAGSIADHSSDWWPGLRRRGRLRGARVLRRALPVRPRAPPARRRGRRRRCRSTREGAALGAAGLCILFPPLAVLIIAGPRVAADRRPPPRGREVRRAADPAVS